MIKAVFGTNVFLQALINPHSRCDQFLDEFVDDYELVLSPAIIREILEVLHRPRLRAKFPHITQLNIARIIALFEQATVVEPKDVPSVSRDPADDKFLACTKLAGAEYLVSEDKDLLVLEVYEDSRTCQPAEFNELLSALRAQASE